MRTKSLLTLVAATMMSGCGVSLMRGPPPETPANLALSPEQVQCTPSPFWSVLDGVWSLGLGTTGYDMKENGEEGYENFWMASAAFALSGLIGLDRSQDCKRFIERVQVRPRADSLAWSQGRES